MKKQEKKIRKVVLTQKNITAIELSILIGTWIKRDFPFFAEKFREGYLLTHIVRSYNLSEKYKVSHKIAHGAVRYALRGYLGELELIKSVTPYFGLIPLGEYIRLAKNHKENFGKILGDLNRDNQAGMFSLTKEDMAKARKKGFENMGMVAFSTEESNFVEVLSQKPEFQMTRQNYRNVAKIAEEVNKKFHNGEPIRTNLSISQHLIRIKRKKKPDNP